MSLRALSLVGGVYPKRVGRHWDRLAVPLSTVSSSSSPSSPSSLPTTSTATSTAASASLSTATGQGFIDQPLPTVSTTTTSVLNPTIESSLPNNAINGTDQHGTSTTGTTPPPSTTTTTSSSSSPAPAESAIHPSTSLSSSSSFSSYKLPPWLEKALELWKKQSGTSEVLQLKQEVALKSQAFDVATARVTHARRHLDQTMLLWERINGQHLQLLQKRDTWTSYDAQQFATLVGQEVETRTQMENARTDLAQAEATLSHCQWEYMNAMRKRYHEEQIWQDQWRILGTYGTWSLIVLNSCVFLLSQFFHYRREAQKMKHLETLVKENVASQQAFKDSMIAERQAFAQTSGLLAPTASENDHTQNTSKNDAEVAASTTITDEVVQVNSTVQSLSEGETPDVPTSNPNTPTTTTDSERIRNRILTGTWVWLASMQDIKWVQSIVSSDIVQTTVQQTKGILTTSHAQTREFLQEVHLPSALLGASVTGMAVIATMLLSSTSLVGRGR